MATRVEQALTLPSQRIPAYFEHAVTMGKPIFTMPATLALDASDTQRFQLWMSRYENGVLSGTEEMNVSPALAQAMQAFKDYAASPPYHAWSVVDEISRDSQYRLFLVDVIQAVNARATMPPSQDPTGAGSNPIAVGDVGTIGGQPSTPPGELVTDGDPVNPTLVYGDDASAVTVGP